MTSVEAEGSEGSIHVIYVMIKRHDLEASGEAIRNFNPNAFYTVEDVRFVMKGIFPMKKRERIISRLSALSYLGERGNKYLLPFYLSSSFNGVKDLNSEKSDSLSSFLKFSTSV